MSVVISFRLDPDNPREALAIDVIRSCQQKGFSVRQIMVESLVKLDLEGNPSYTKQLHQINEKMAELIFLFRTQSENGGLEGKVELKGDRDQELSGQFINAMKMVMKPGLESR